MAEDQFQWETMRIATSGTLDYGDLAPFLQEMHKRHKFIETSVPQLGNEPPAAGMTEIALMILALNSTAIPFLRGFFEEWGKINAQGLRDSLRDIFDKGRVSRTGSGRRFIPCLVQLGNVRFYFHDVQSDEDFLGQLHSAEKYVMALPDNAFQGSSPMENGLFWNRELAQWEEGIPENIWG